MAASGVQISAHAGDRSATIETFRTAVATGADYVELDIRRTADGELVSFHDARTARGEPLSTVGYAQLCDLAGYRVPTVADVLATITGHAKGHLDLKDTGGEDAVVRLALDVLGPGQFIITTLEDSSVAAIRSRFESADDVPVALSLGRNMAGASRTRVAAHPAGQRGRCPGCAPAARTGCAASARSPEPGCNGSAAASTSRSWSGRSTPNPSSATGSAITAPTWSSPTGRPGHRAARPGVRRPAPLAAPVRRVGIGGEQQRHVEVARGVVRGDGAERDDDLGVEPRPPVIGEVQAGRERQPARAAGGLGREPEPAVGVGDAGLDRSPDPPSSRTESSTGTPRAGAPATASRMWVETVMTPAPSPPGGG